jgi:hypothetical protein
MHNGILRFADTHGNYVDSYTLTDSYLNRWIFIAGVFDGKKGDKVSPDTAQIYINGKPAGHTWSNTSWDPTDETSTTGFQIGTMDGMIDEVRVLSRALSGNDIENDYLAGHHLPIRYGIAAWYHLDEGTGTVAVDASSNHNNLTISSSDLWVPLIGVNVYSSLQNIFGSPGSITGTETRSIAISLEGISQETYDIGGTLNITVNDYYSYSKSFSLNFTKYWISYITDSLNATGLEEGIDYTVTGNTVHIAYVENANINMIYLSMEIER